MKETLRCGRLELGVTTGTSSTVFMHEIAAPRDIRHAEMTANHEQHGAWVYDQRGHGRSSWTAGGTYQLIDFAMDLAALCEHIGEPVAIIADGASGFAAALAASAYPDRITSITWRYYAQGWSQLTHVMIGDAWLPNPIWLQSTNWEQRAPWNPANAASNGTGITYGTSSPVDTEYDCDPHLLLGPPDVLNRKHLRDAFEAVTCPILMTDGDTAERSLHDLLHGEARSAVSVSQGQSANGSTLQQSRFQTPLTTQKPQFTTQSCATQHSEGTL